MGRWIRIDVSLYLKVSTWLEEKEVNRRPKLRPGLSQLKSDLMVPNHAHQPLRHTPRMKYSKQERKKQGISLASVIGNNFDFLPIETAEIISINPLIPQSLGHQGGHP